MDGINSTAWVCDSCHTNNFAADGVCRNCGLVPGSATGAVQRVSHETPPERPADRPLFVQSRHADVQQRSTIFLTPPTPAPKPAPRPPTRPRASAKAGRWLILGAFALAAVAIVLVSVFRSSSSSSANSPSSSQVACPNNVAEYLPGGGSGAVLIGQYTDDDNHIVTICVIPSSGQYYYDGQIKDQPVNPTTHISLPASQTGSGYVAVNGAYTFQITGSGLIVSKNGTMLRESKLTQIAP